MIERMRNPCDDTAVAYAQSILYEWAQAHPEQVDDDVELLWSALNGDGTDRATALQVFVENLPDWAEQDKDLGAMKSVNRLLSSAANYDMLVVGASEA